MGGAARVEQGVKKNREAANVRILQTNICEEFRSVLAMAPKRRLASEILNSSPEMRSLSNNNSCSHRTTCRNFMVLTFFLNVNV